MVNPDQMILLKKVNRGEDLRWVGSRCPLTRALKSYCFITYSKLEHMFRSATAFLLSKIV